MSQYYSLFRKGAWHKLPEKIMADGKEMIRISEREAKEGIIYLCPKCKWSYDTITTFYTYRGDDEYHKKQWCHHCRDRAELVLTKARYKKK